jgi:hypothetical protein
MRKFCFAFLFFFLVEINADAQIYGQSHVSIATIQGPLEMSTIYGGKGEDSYFLVKLNGKDLDKIYGNEIRFDEEKNEKGLTSRLLIYNSEGGFSDPHFLLLYDFRKKPPLISKIGDTGLDVSGSIKWMPDGVLLRLVGVPYKGRWYKFNGRKLIPAPIR